MLVLGGKARSIGLYAAGIAVALGARRVRYADDDRSLLEMYSTGVTLHAGRAMVRPVIEPVLDLVARRRLRPDVVTDRVVPWRDAATALLEPHTKLVFTHNGSSAA